jgi:hypothetical protein
MNTKRFVIVAAAAVLAAFVTPAAADAKAQPQGLEVSTLATFGSGLAAGSTIGPDSALYVTDPNAGSVLRVDRQTGEVTTFAEGLPPQVLGIGGAMDVAFIGGTAYVLVTMVGGDIVDGDHIGDDVVGIHRLEDDGSFTVIADIGAWSIEYPPETDYFLTTGVQYALQRYGRGFLVTDGHHNRVLRVGLDGTIEELIAFDNIVPTGLDTFGVVVVMGQAGPLPHLPEAGKVVTLGPTSTTAADVANGASLIVDVEIGGDRTLYALSQGQWDEVAEGSPARPDTGRLVTADRNGQLVPVVDAAGNELVLDRPTSLELIGDTAYVVGLDGTITEIDNL